MMIDFLTSFLWLNLLESTHLYTRLNNIKKLKKLCKNKDLNMG